MSERATFGLIGQNISNSFSPFIHSLFSDYEYLLLDIEDVALGSFFDGNNKSPCDDTAMHFLGINVTMPHKRNVFRLCDDLSELSKRTGTVNTVLFLEGGALGDNAVGFNALGHGAVGDNAVGFNALGHGAVGDNSLGFNALGHGAVGDNSLGFNALGFNTDYFGLWFLLQKSEIGILGKSVLILGTGGSGHTAKVLCQDLGASSVTFLNSKKVFLDENLEPLSDGSLTFPRKATSASNPLPNSFDVVINCTPQGSSLISLREFPSLEGVIDIVYSPLSSPLVSEARQLNINTSGGLAMLVAQAGLASLLFDIAALCQEDVMGSTGIPPTLETFEKIIDESFQSRELLTSIEKVYRHTLLTFSDIVIIGMPGSGKTQFGKALAKELGRPFFDVDQEIASLYGSPENLILQHGEAHFRQIESHVINGLTSFGSVSADGFSQGVPSSAPHAARIISTGSASTTPHAPRIISTGGGSALTADNITALKKNGVLVFLDTPLDKLAHDHRPLSALDTLPALYEERLPHYLSAADLVLENHDHQGITQLCSKFLALFPLG